MDYFCFIKINHFLARVILPQKSLNEKDFAFTLIDSMYTSNYNV